MNFFKKYKIAILSILLVVILGIGYSVFFVGESDTASLVSDRVGSPGDVVVGKNLLALLLTLQSIDLKEDIFTDPAFRRLEDFSLELAPQSVGRVNPFAPLSTSGR